jgi:hypothetical protein
MRRLRFLMSIWFLLIIAAISAIVMLLWNWLMPALFGLITINFWQALGLFVLAKILFGGWGLNKEDIMRHAMHHHHLHGNPIHKEWMKMTPEQRKEFIDKRRKFGFGDPFDRGHFDAEEFQEKNKENE